MKERTRNLFELAENDLKVATDTVEAMPNVAAFHAQQCEEKALKAMVWELSKEIDEDQLRAKIKHDSIRAVTRVLAHALKDTMSRSGFFAMEGKLRKQRGTAGGSLALLIYLSASSMFENVFALMEKMPISKEQDYWGKSLETSLKPDPTFNREWLKQLDKAGEFTNILLEFLTTIAGDSPIAPLEGRSPEERADAARSWLEKTAADLRAKDRKTEAISVERAILELNRWTNPDSSFLEWMKLVIFWTPYLDAHAIRARYAPPNELRKYHKHRAGVKNLISVSKQVLEQSKSVLGVFSQQ